MYISYSNVFNLQICMKGEAMSQHEVQEWVRRRLAQESWMRDLEERDEQENEAVEDRRAS
jgi:hypothetical protein